MTTWLTFADLLRQSVNRRLADYEDVNDAERLSQDPTFQLIGSEKIWERVQQRRCPPGECSLVVPPRWPRLLAAAMARLVNDPETCRAMGRRARKRTETDFSEDRYIESHLQLLRTILHGAAAGD